MGLLNAACCSTPRLNPLALEGGLFTAAISASRPQLISLDPVSALWDFGRLRFDLDKRTSLRHSAGSRPPTYTSVQSARFSVCPWPTSSWVVALAPNTSKGSLVADQIANATLAREETFRIIFPLFTLGLFSTHSAHCERDVAIPQTGRDRNRVLSTWGNKFRASVTSH